MTLLQVSKNESYYFVARTVSIILFVNANNTEIG